MASILWLITASLRILLQHGGRGAAIELAKMILNEHIKAIYRCLAAGQASCMTAALDLLAEMCTDPGLVSFMVATVDLSHKGITAASKMRRTVTPKFTSFSSRPRIAYISCMVKLVQQSDYETRLLLSKTPFILHQIIHGLGYDSPEIVSSVLTTILDHLIYNEEDNRNLAVAFLKANQLPLIGQILESKNDENRKATRSFLLSCFERAGKGLCYAVDQVATLKNKLLSDLINDLDIVNKEQNQELALEMMQNCPDVAWFFLSSGRISLDFNDSLRYASSVSLAIKLILLCPCSKGETALVPRSFHRQVLSRGLVHEVQIVKLNTLLLIVALMKRLPWIDDGKVREDLRRDLPDFKTVYNAWRQKTSTMDEEEEELVRRCFLEVIHNYLRLDVVNDLSSMIRMQDFAVDDRSSELSDAAMQICMFLDPIELLDDNESLEIAARLCKSGSSETVWKLLETWIWHANLSSDVAFVKGLVRDLEDPSPILRELHRIYNVPVIFDARVDPLKQLLVPETVRQEQLIALGERTMEEEEEERKTKETNESVINADERRPKRKRVEINIEETMERLFGDDAPTFLNSIMAQVRRSNIMDSFVDVSPSSTITPISDVKDLVLRLVKTGDISSWLRLMALALSHPQSFKLDLRLMVETAVLGYAIIGLSLVEDALRRMSHLILYRFLCAIERTRVREKGQIAMLLRSLCGHLTPQGPLTPLPRLLVYFYSEALPIFLRPDNALYRPLNELFLALATPTHQDVFRRLFADTNEEWVRELGWTLQWLDRASGRQGEYVETCDFERLHVVENLSILLLSGTGIEPGQRRLAYRILCKTQPCSSHAILPLITPSLGIK